MTRVIFQAPRSWEMRKNQPVLQACIPARRLHSKLPQMHPSATVSASSASCTVAWHGHCRRPALRAWINEYLCDPEVALQTPKPRKIQRHEKVTQKWLSGCRWKLLKSYSKVTQNWLFRPFLTLLSNFWVTFTGAPKVAFESLFRVFEFFGVWGSVGLRWRSTPRKSFDASLRTLFSSIWAFTLYAFASVIFNAAIFWPFLRP